MEFPVEALRRLAAPAAGAKGHMCTAWACGSQVPAVSIVLAYSSRAYRNRLDDGRRPTGESFGFATIASEDR
jgi:hypothetical protein